MRVGTWRWLSSHGLNGKLSKGREVPTSFSVLLEQACPSPLLPSFEQGLEFDKVLVHSFHFVERDRRREGGREGKGARSGGLVSLVVIVIVKASIRGM